MALRKIVTLGDEALRKECKKVDKFNLRLHLLLKDMLDTMYEANGVGLAAEPARPGGHCVPSGESAGARTGPARQLV